ncbi:uncharacterized protein [Periplaneta americana]|uniref:uncharacterized protein n=1 Tax=Periplaneta americana TaxID=6978 RepID=UPI0037E6FAB3
MKALFIQLFLHKQQVTKRADMFKITIKIVALATCLSCVVASSTDDDSFTRLMLRVYQDCGKKDNLFACLKIRALKAADRLLATKSIPLGSGVNFVKTAGEETARALKLEPLNEEALPADLEEKQSKLNEMLLSRTAAFFQTHSIQLDMPRLIDDVEEGRRRKKMGGLLLLGGLLKGGMLAMGMKGLAVLAGKALLVAKIALVLSALAGLSGLMGGGKHSEGHTTYEILQTPHYSFEHDHSTSFEHGGHFETSGHGHYRRSTSDMYPLAYRAQNKVRPLGYKA